MLEKKNEYSSSDAFPTALGTGHTVENKIDAALFI